MKRILILPTLLSILLMNALSQENDSLKAPEVFNMSLEELLKVKVQVSSTLPVELFESPSTVAVINRQLIEQYNFQSIAEAVRMVAGVEVLQTVIDRNVPTVRGILQNFYANKVLILIDNIPVWHPTYGNSTLDRLSINDVERIEVLKGPASVLYGTNAFNGVINIITRAPEESTLYARFDAGYPSIGSGAINYTHFDGDFSWNISASSSYERRNPYLFKAGADTLFITQSSISAGDTSVNTVTLYENDTLYNFQEEYRNNSFNLSLTYKSHTLYVNSFINSYNTPGINVTYNTGANRPITDKGTIIAYTFENNLTNKTNLRLNAYYDYHFRDQSVAQAYEWTARFSSYRMAVTAKVNHEFSSVLKSEIGAEIYNGRNLGHYIWAVAPDTMLRENIKNEKDITEGSVFGQLSYRYKWFSILGGARFSQSVSFGKNVSPRVSAMFEINKTNVIKYVYGHSFRTPNQLELYFDHWSVVGNPNLEPELCRSFEFMYLTRISNVFGQITFFDSRYKNLIQRIRISEDISQPAVYQNAEEFDSYGLEVEVKYQNPKVLNLTLNYNIISGRGENSAENFKYVPEHTVFLGMNKPIKNYFISSNIYAYSSTNGPWEEISAQFMLDFHGGYRHTNKKGLNLTHTLSFKNITNSAMLIPEYIRQRPGVNHLETTGFGRRIIYTMNLSF